MPLSIRDNSNTQRTVVELWMRDTGNTPREVQELWARDATNTPRMIYSTAPPMSASITPSLVFGVTLGTGTVDTDAATMSASGGTAPYTYAWTITAYTSAVSPSVLNPTSASTAFRQTSLGIGAAESADIQCVATDANGFTVSATCQAFFTDAT